MRAAVSIAAIAVLFGARPAVADESPAPPAAAEESAPVTVTAPTPASAPASEVAAPESLPEPRSISRSRQALAVAVAIVPGVIVRGLGSTIVDRGPTAKRLAWVGGIGFGAILLGAIPLGVSRGNPYTILPAVPLVVAGTGLFMSSWFADLWVAAGGPCAAGEARALVPWSIEVGASWLGDAYRKRALLRGAARLTLGRVELSAGGHRDARGAATYGDLGARVRIIGAPATGAVIADGSGLWIRGLVRARDDDDDRVRVFTAEIDAMARMDLLRLDPILRGTFTELGVGIGGERVGLAGGREHDLGSLLLARFGFGAYLGRRGEIAAFYDHRRDQLAGGIAAGRAAGFVGSVGGSLDLRIAGPWAVRSEIELGSARVGTLLLRYQGGPP